MVIIVLVAIPLLRWFFIEPLNFRFFNFIGTMTSLGQITGIVGLTLFSLNLILSVRIKAVERFFYGLDRIYDNHHKIGAISFSLLLFHPLFLVVSYLSVSLRAAVDFFMPFTDIPITYGIVALFLMIILLGLTFYSKLRYHRWKFTHKFMVLAFVFALLHSLTISSDISRDAFLRIYLLTLGLLGLGAGFYQAVLSRLFNSHVRYNLKAVNIINARTVELELEPKTKGIKFYPGQFVFIRFLAGDIKPESHPFSITTGEEGANLHLVIKSLGDFTGQVKKLVPGIPVDVEGPYGKFSHLNVANKNQIWIAGGVGITPFISMARSLNTDDYKIDLYYAVNSADEVVLLNELKAIETRKSLRLIPWYTNEKGYLNARAISGLSPNLENSDILMCGPSAFMFSLRQQFVDLGIKKKHIHFENFKLL